MIQLYENKIRGVSFLASEDFRYIIEHYTNGFVKGIDTTTMEETSSVPAALRESVLSDMKEKFHKDFCIVSEGMSAKDIKAKSDRLKRLGYSCIYDLGDSSVTITSKEGKTVYTAVGREVDRVVQSFEEDPVSFDTTISLEDYCLAKFL